MKSRFLLTAGLALSMFFAACSDDSASANPIDAGKDDGQIADETPSDTTTHKKSSVDTEDGATFETKGNPSYSDYGISESYEGGIRMVDAVYTAEPTSVMEPGGVSDMTVLDEYIPVDYAPGGGDGGFNGKTYGLLTASEWNDLDNWSSWTEIMSGEFASKADYWDFDPRNLAAVQVVDENGIGIANVSVKLLKGDNEVFATKTDNKGYAYCWVNLFDGGTEEVFKDEDFSLKINGEISEAPVKLTSIGNDSLKVNVVTSDAKQADAKADIAFIVDATGSMGDEIRFLQSDLKYIIDHAHSETKVALRTAVEFYRDEEDEYIILGKDFSTNVANTQAFIDEQYANGGGDYPEAVHTALENSLQKFSWNESARARIAFLILDAPAHHQDDVIESLQKSITLYAKHGIKLIPVAASGVDKDTESMLRFFEIITGGTYVFLTDDSGIGYSHLEASVGDTNVEKLADLMIRLIKKYVE